MDLNTVGNLSSTGINAIKLLGGNSNLDIAPKSSYILIGKKGASEGSRPVKYFYFFLN